MKKILIVVAAVALLGVAEHPKISMEKARSIALKKVPHGTIQSAELERESGKLIYSFDVKQKNVSGITEVNVDAMNGKVIAVQHESAAKEAAEKRSEKH